METHVHTFVFSEWTVLAFSCLQYKIASTPLSVASVRQQFSLKENIHLSMWSFQFLQSASRHLTVPGEDEVDIQLFQAGYLFLASERGKATLKENYDLQKWVLCEMCVSVYIQCCQPLAIPTMVITMEPRYCTRRVLHPLGGSQDSSFTENNCLAMCLHMRVSLGTYIMRLLQWWPWLRHLCMSQFIDVICKYVLDYYLYCCGIGPTLSMILLVLKIWCVIVRKTSTLISLSQRLTSV